MSSWLNEVSAVNFSFQDVQHLILRHNNGMSSEQVFREAQRFLQLEILIPLAKSSQLELESLRAGIRPATDAGTAIRPRHRY